MNLQNHDGGMAEPVRGVNKNTANEATKAHFFHQVSKKISTKLLIRNFSERIQKKNLV